MSSGRAVVLKEYYGDTQAIVDLSYMPTVKENFYILNLRVGRSNEAVAMTKEELLKFRDVINDVVNCAGWN